jgi:hypothetical protein
MLFRFAPVLLLPAFPAHAAEPWLQAVPLECAALEAVISFGLAADSGNISVLEGLLQDGDGAACASELAALGFGEGLNNPVCRQALELFAAFGPPSPEGDPGALVHDFLTGASPESCALTVEFFAQQ